MYTNDIKLFLIYVNKNVTVSHCPTCNIKYVHLLIIWVFFFPFSYTAFKVSMKVGAFWITA